MKKLRSQKAETLVETLMAILVVVLVMLFLSTAVSTASKVNAKVRKTDVALTYKNAVKALDVIAACPADRMLLETDSPYLAPVPNRGKRNDSRNLPYIAARIAEIKGMTTDQVAEVTLKNGKQLFGI